MRVSGLTLALFVAGSIATLTQTQPGQPAPGVPAAPGQRTPARATPRASDPTGTAIMRGQVTSTDGTPLRRAQVRAFAQDGKQAGSVVSTDAQGRFEMRELPAGRYAVSAMKAGYVTMQFGQRRPDQSATGTILDILDDQLVEKILIALPRGGVVTGRILDDFGEPIAGAQVQAQRDRFVNGARRLSGVSSDSTDDTGHFRIYGLPPGEYVISGTVRSPSFGIFAQSLGDTEGFAPGYYPGTSNAAEAQRVTVKGGQEVSGVNFALTAARLARVRGRVVSAEGDPPAAPLMVMVATGEGAMSMMNNAQTRGDGTFQITGLAPGSYMLMARGIGNTPRPEIANLRLTVANQDIDNALMVLSPGAIARGAITTDENSPLPFNPQTVMLYSTLTDPSPDFGSGSSPTVNNDWSFEISGLFNQRMLRATLRQPGDWYMKGVYYRDQEVTDTPIDFQPGQVLEGFTIVFTRKISEISGIVTDERSQPVRDAQIVVFPNDSTRWTFGSRYLRLARVDQSGRFQVRNLPPYDEYRVIAVRDLEDGRYSDPEFLNEVRDGAARVLLREGQTAVQDLKVQRAP